jgi:esterase/lipase superfamily enzyme
MRRDYITRYSEAVGKDMNVIVYGDGGYPVVVFQVQDAKCNNFEDFGMIDTLSDYLEEGIIQIFSVDNFDEDSWSAFDADPAWRAERQEAYFSFVTEELVPFVADYTGLDVRPLAMGCSMGATHAVIAALRRPDLFQGCIALSGVYDAKYFFGDYMDGTLYENSPATFMPNMPFDHPYVQLYSQRQIVMCVGQGAWEDEGIRSMQVLDEAFSARGISAWFDYWGTDVNHDWPWWKKQIRYFLPIVLDDIKLMLDAEEA